MSAKNAYDFSDRVAVLTGGAGVLGSAMAGALAGAGAQAAILDINREAAEQVAAGLRERGSRVLAFQVNVLDRASIEQAAQQVLSEFGHVDILINGAGGNRKEATTSFDLPFFDLPPDALRWVCDLNLLGTILPCQVFGRVMVEQGAGCILNISSMAAFRPLTRTVAYSAAKAGVSNFTQWLAVHLSQTYKAQIRVNAIAPGFLLTEQNRYLLTQEGTGEFTERGRSIVSHTPMGRLGCPEDLVGAVLWLCSDSASFVNGAILPIDGAFSAFGGV